jgi:hypothetical protein
MIRTVIVNFKGLTLVCTGEYQHDELRGFEFESIVPESETDIYDLLEVDDVLTKLETVVLDAIAAEDAEPKEEEE